MRDADAVSLWSRQGKELTRCFPVLVDVAADVIPLDVSLMAKRSCGVMAAGFSSLQQRLAFGARNLSRLVGREPDSYVAFDLLAVAGQDTRPVPFRDRRALLEERGKDWPAQLGLSPTTATPG